METSFVSEHSVELIVGPTFGNILRNTFKKVTPIYFWSSREGGRMSRDCYYMNKVRVIALYPRRPKVVHPYSKEILIKFNQNLFERSSEFKTYGIPVFAGVPLASSLDMFHFGIECAWFRIRPEGSECELEFSLREKSDIFLPGIQQVSDAVILESVDQESNYMPWADAQKVLRSLNERSGTIWERSIWGDRYKPIYFLIPFDQNILF